MLHARACAAIATAVRRPAAASSSQPSASRSARVSRSGTFEAVPTASDDNGADAVRTVPAPSGGGASTLRAACRYPFRTIRRTRRSAVERGLYIAASGMLADQLRQDVIANNLANSTTAGYKGDQAVGEAFSSLLLNEITTGRQVGSLGTGARIAGVYVNSAQGALRNTGNQLDLAIAGDGFFAVRGPGGVRYTRDGAFTTDATGQLVTAGGLPVLDRQNRPITIPGGAEPTIDASGNVTVGGRAVATLQVATLDPASLRKQGDDLFTGRAQR